MAKKDKPAGALERMPPAAAPAGIGVRGFVTKLTGAKLCYGKPVRQGDYTVIPVAAVRAAGGYGVGRGVDEQGGEGGGGGGAVLGRPLGYIELGPAGTRFEPIRHGGLAGRGAALALGAGAGAVAGAGLVATGAAGFVAGRRVSGLVRLALRPRAALRRRRRGASPSSPRWLGR